MPLTFVVADLSDDQLKALLTGVDQHAAALAAAPLLDALDEAQVRAELAAFERHARAHADASVAEQIGSHVRSALSLAGKPDPHVVSDSAGSQAWEAGEALLATLDQIAERHGRERRWREERLIPARCGCLTLLGGPIVDPCQIHGRW